MCAKNIKDHDRAFRDFGGKTVKMYAITSQDPTNVEKAVEKWKLRNTSVVGDPNNRIVDFLKQHYLPDLVMGEKAGYPHGMVQPAELVFHRDKVIVEWVKQPSMINMNGAFGRPNVKEMWKNITTHLSKDAPA